MACNQFRFTTNVNSSPLLIQCPFPENSSCSSYQYNLQERERKKKTYLSSLRYQLYIPMPCHMRPCGRNFSREFQWRALPSKPQFLFLILYPPANSSGTGPERVRVGLAMLSSDHNQDTSTIKQQASSKQASSIKHQTSNAQDVAAPFNRLPSATFPLVSFTPSIHPFIHLSIHPSVRPSSAPSLTQTFYVQPPSI